MKKYATCCLAFAMRYGRNSTIVAFQQPTYLWHPMYRYQHHLRMSTSLPPPPSTGPELEIEKKFCISNESDAKKMAQTLDSLGFRIIHREDFIDWYFDLTAPNWHFSLQDCWFRYREKKVKIMNNYGWRGVWQVKRGKKKEDGEKVNDDGMTVYEELQGKEAKELILAMLSQLDSDTSDTAAKTSESSSTPVESTIHYDHDIPYLEGAESLAPFAAGNIPYLLCNKRWRI